MEKAVELGPIALVLIERQLHPSAESPHWKLRSRYSSECQQVLKSFIRSMC